LIRSIFSISLPSAAESALFSVGILALSGFAFRLGTESSAAHQIVNQVESFSFLPCIGFSGAASALVGQALGMGDPQRAFGSGSRGSGPESPRTTSCARDCSRGVSTRERGSGYACNLLDYGAQGGT